MEMDTTFLLRLGFGVWKVLVWLPLLVSFFTCSAEKSKEAIRYIFYRNVLIQFILFLGNGSFHKPN